MQSLHDAILEAILNGGMLSDETLEKLLGKDWQQADDAEERLDELIRQIIEKLQHQGYLTGAAREPGHRRPQGREGQGGGQGGREGSVRFEITDKSLDFLGYRALRDLLGSIGKSSLGRHDTREMATGIEASGAPKAVRVRRHDEHRRQQHDPERGQAAAERRRPGGRGRLRRPDGRPGRVPELVRDRPDARLQPQHDPLRRGSLHAGQARRAGARQPDPPAVSRRRAAGRAVPRLGRRDSAQPARARARRPVLHQHARRPAPRAAPARAAAQGHAADRHDHRRQAVGADPPRRPHLPQRLRPRSRSSSRRRSPRWPPAARPAS